MKTSDNGRAFIEAFEGKFLHAYNDGTGVLTIGYGHTTVAGPPKVGTGMVITNDQCDQILASDLDGVERDVEKLIHVDLSQPQFDALVSFHFNTGALGRGTVDNKINTGDIDGAMSTLLMYDHAGGRQMAGLTRRRKAERLMFLGQVEAAMALAGAHLSDPGGPMPQVVQQAPTPAVFPTPHEDSFWEKFAHVFIRKD